MANGEWRMAKAKGRPIRYCDSAIHNSSCTPPHGRVPVGASARLGRALGLVALVALLMGGLSLSASRLWAVPDSLQYIQMAVDIAERFDFSSESFLLRTWGYPGLLAAIFALFGPQSPMAILVVQHAMVVVTVLLTALVGWHLTGRTGVALLAGVLSACSLQVLAFANVIMSEVPYMFALITSVYFLVRYHRSERLRFLALASAMAGVSYLFRPTGLTVVGMCLLAAAHRTWVSRARRALAKDGAWPGLRPAGGPAGDGNSGHARAAQVCRRVSGPVHEARSGPRALTAVVAALAPAMAVVAPCAIHNATAHGGQLLNRSMAMSLYNRTAHYDRLDSSDSSALKEIREVVAEAKRLGHIGPRADETLSRVVCRAYRSTRDASFAEACAALSRAAWDLLWAHPGAVADRTARYAVWMLLVPNSTYRFQPGGTKGYRSRPAIDADIFDIGTYQSDPGPYGDALREFSRYVPLSTKPRPATPLWTAVARWFYRHIDAGPPILGRVDSPYEAYVLLCVFGGACSLLTRRRITWLLVGGVIVSQVLAAAFLGGLTPRYGVPIHPLMNLYAALVLVAVARAVAWPVRFSLRRVKQDSGNADHTTVSMLRSFSPRRP